jgi:hypothetical protein
VGVFCFVDLEDITLLKNYFMKNRFLNITIPFFCVITMMYSCKTTKPLVDKTPPAITKWQVIDQSTKEIQSYNGADFKAKVKRGATYLISCYTLDGQGIKSLTVGAEGKYSCKYLNNGSIFSEVKYVVWYPNETLESKEDQNNKVPTSLIFSKEITIKAEYTCDNSKIPFTAEAKNYGNMSTSGSLILNIVE